MWLEQWRRRCWGVGRPRRHRGLGVSAGVGGLLQSPTRDGQHGFILAAV